MVGKFDERPQVLCVDDEPRVLDGLKLTLRRRFIVLVETEPVAALRTLESVPAIVAVVSDMRMPGMDGVTFLAQVARMRPRVARILLSGEMGRAVGFNQREAGASFHVLSKPCTPEQLIATMLAAIGQSTAVEQ